jgi:hypothetical protein
MFPPDMAQDDLPDQEAEQEAGRTGKHDSDAAQRETLDLAENGPSIGVGQG